MDVVVQDYIHVFFSPIVHSRLAGAFPESREYSCFRPHILPKNCEIRRIGSITVDKQAYGRYSGGVQMLCRCFPADPQVHVLGHVAPDSLPLAFCAKNGASFALTPWS